MSKDTSKIRNGGYADMIKERKAEYPTLRQTVDEVLSKWDGGLLCVMRVDEDENGDPTGVQTFVGGVSKLSASIALAETATDTAKTLAKRVKSSVMEDMVNDLMKMLKEALGKD